MTTLSKQQNILLWGLKILAAAIMLQTLFFKFTGAEESVYIFSTLGIEPWGRIGSGVVELIASILLFVPGKAVYGAVLGAGVMSGAIFSHLTELGLVVKNDGGQLFIYALLVFISCAVIVFFNRQQLFDLLGKKKAA